MYGLFLDCVIYCCLRNWSGVVLLGFNRSMNYEMYTKLNSILQLCFYSYGMSNIQFGPA